MEKQKGRESWKRSLHQKSLNFTHLHFLIKVYDLHFLGSGLLLSNTMWCKYASLSYLFKTPQKPFRGRMKRRKISKAFGEDYTHWAIEWFIWGTYFLFVKLIKPLERKLIKEWMTSNSVITILSCKHPRTWKSNETRKD